MNAEDFRDIRLEIENGVGKIIINRPDKLNAIRVGSYRELISAFRIVDENDQCHVILLTGEGGQFTAGNDLTDLVDGDPDEVMQGVEGIFDRVANLKKVLVAAVEGVAVGIGTTILLHCDLVAASKSAKFRLPFANLGVCPEGGSSVLLAQEIGQKMARDVLLTGRFFSAEEALQWGFINMVTEPGNAGEGAQQYIAQLLQQPLSSLIATKRLMRVSRPNVSQIVSAELLQFSQLLQTDQTQKRIQALLKR